MKNVKIPRYSAVMTNSAVNSAAQIPRIKPKFSGSARNSAGLGKLGALAITLKDKTITKMITYITGRFFVSM